MCLWGYLGIVEVDFDVVQQHPFHGKYMGWMWIHRQEFLLQSVQSQAADGPRDD